MDEYESLNYAKWHCKYRVVFNTQVPQEDTLRATETASWRGVPQTCGAEGKPDRERHRIAGRVPMMISIPPQYAVSQVTGSIKGNSAIHLAWVDAARTRNFAGQ
jgi:putative transposase